MAAADLLNSEQGYYDEVVPGVDALRAEQRYGTERAKRLRDDGNRQFIDVSLSDKFKHFQEDPWAGSRSINDLHTMFPTRRCKLLILGAGLGGIMYAVRFIEAGIKPEDIRIIDTAGGFGGTWYWNRYPGISCDVESYCYLPLLEETGYIPKQRLSSGEEIRHHAEQIAQKWGVKASAVFQTKATGLEWDETTKEWEIGLQQQRNGEPANTLQVRSSFVAAVNGVLNWPKLPDLPGLLDYEGKIFHSSRWDYSCTGGAPGDPSLVNLKDKKVALVGTGSSGVQLAPYVARWAEHLYVVQRTPASVDRRGQCETDQDLFRNTVATSSGWQRERLKNLHQHLTTGQLPAVNKVNDGWTRAVGMVAVSGNPDAHLKGMEELPAYLQLLHSKDLPRQNRIRHRIKQQVKDPSTVDKLQPWYPTWCKRPAFSDEYLPMFNRENVTLLDTDAKGVERFTSDAIVVNGKEYPVDIVILATGFRAPFAGTPAEKANLKIIGRNGVSMSEAWARSGPTTLHGVMDHNFPNLFLAGPWQSTISPNNLFSTNALAEHAAYILKEAQKKAAGKPFEVAPTADAVQDWGMQILMRSPPMAAMIGCTPSYFNMEGELDRVPLEKQMIVAKSGLWGAGVEDYLSHIEAWRADGGMKGIEVRVET